VIFLVSQVSDRLGKEVMGGVSLGYVEGEDVNYLAELLGLPVHSVSAHFGGQLIHREIDTSLERFVLTPLLDLKGRKVVS